MSAFRTVVLFAAVLALTACTTTGERSTARVAPEHSGAVDTHHEYVAHVEAVARRRGIDVQWVNAPVKRTQRDD